MGSDKAQQLYDELKQIWSTGKDERRTNQLLAQLKVSLTGLQFPGNMLQSSCVSTRDDISSQLTLLAYSLALSLFRLSYLNLVYSSLLPTLI